jgi:hypothetical protein
MAKYIVKQEASILFYVEVEASTEEEALEIGQAQLFDGDGVEVPYSFEWQEYSSVEEKKEN